jgi:predicted esterase
MKRQQLAMVVLLGTSLLYAPVGKQAAAFLADKAKAQKPDGKDGRKSKPVFLGISFEGDTLKIGQVEKGGPADKAGVRPGDVVVKFGGDAIKSREQLATALRTGRKPGDKVALVVQRDDKPVTFEVQLGERPGYEGLQEVRVAAPTRIDWQFVWAGKSSAAKPDDGYDSRKQHYLLYVPKNYDGAKAWPLVVFISPQNNPAAWRFWRKSCEDLGMLYCEAYDAGNNCPVDRRTRIVLDMLDDVRRDYRIDTDQTYLTGLSGGGRMACTIGYALPEYFAGVLPICGTNPLSKYAYLRHRVHDRQSVAFVTGTGDFNRRENEDYMAPLFSGLDIRSKLWVVKDMGHTIPGPEVLTEVLKWLAADLPRRRADAKARPGLAVKPDEAPSAEQQAARLLENAKAEAKDQKRIWQAAAMAQGVVERWGKSDAAASARKFLKALESDPQQARLLKEQRDADERKEKSAREGVAKAARSRQWAEIERRIAKLPEAEKAAAMAVKKWGGMIALDDKSQAIAVVDLRGRKVADGDLKELKPLKGLRQLILVDTKVTDAGLKELKDMTKLQLLFIGGTKVTDAGLKELKGMTELQRLGLSRTVVTDAGLRELHGLKGLRQLIVAETKVTDEGVAEIEKALPELKIAR